MTLPFRRRHHDAEAGHDRARVLMSEALLTTLPPDDAAWLGRHLDSCTGCGRDWKAFRADHRLMRRLRDQPLEPPRDLWARTSAALDREARRRTAPRATRAARRQPSAGVGWRVLPLGAVAGALVVAVFLGSRLIDVQSQAPSSGAPGTEFANVPSAGPTGLTLPDADPVSIFRKTASGSWELVSMDVTEVCPPSDRGCVPQEGGKGQSIDLGGPPSEVTLGDGQLVISSPPENGTGGDVLVVPVRGPGESPAPSRTPTDGPTSAPATSEAPTPTPAPTPEGAVAIASGVRVIGDVAYSDDGRWLAFSAAPADDSTGPDLYLWSVGEAKATRVTSDHQTYFASWHRGRILASRVELSGVPEQPAGSTDPGASAAPGATDKPGRGNQAGQGGGNDGEKTRSTPAPTSSPDLTPGTSTSPAPSSVEGHPVSFLLDPESLERTDLTRPDVWLPVLDPSGRYATYWSGTLRSDDGGRRWALGTGELVLDGWSSGNAASTGTPRATSSSAGATSAPSPGTPLIGPAGQPTTLVPGAKATFEASFDPDGAHLAIWVGEGLDESVGRLHLVVIDPATGAVDTASPLRGEAALRRFTIDRGRVAWVTPSGQDGQESSVQVLGWKGDDFGEIETEPASDLYLP